jgi:hypothetical protein
LFVSPRLFVVYQAKKKAMSSFVATHGLVLDAACYQITSADMGRPW